MTPDDLKVRLRALSDAVKARWGKLTDDDLALIKANIDRLTGRMWEIYGETRENLRQRLERITEKTRERSEQKGR